MNETLGIAYFVTFGLVVVAFYILWRRLEPKARKKWHPRLMVAGLVVISPFLLTFAFAARDLVFLAGFCVTIALAMVTIRQTRVCAACGAVAQARAVFVAASFCSKCGAALTPTRFLGGDS